MRKVIIIGLLLLVAAGCQSGAVRTDVTDAKESIKHPWAGCGPGSFVHYKLLRPGGQIEEQKQVVIETAPAHVIVEAFMRAGDEWRSKGKTIIPLQKLDRPPGGMMASKEDALTVNGRQLKCKVSSYKDSLGREVWLWMSSQVPGGVVRHTNDNMVILELVDFAKK